ncbi:MAG: SRPBCC family protein [Myxococcota bacterium]
MTDPILTGRYRISSRVDVNASPQAVWEVLADFSAVDTWAPQVLSSHALTDHDRGHGAGRSCRIEGFGEIDEFIVDWKEGRSLAFSISPVGPFSGSTARWSVIPNADGTCAVEVELAYSLRFGPLGQLLHALVMRGRLEANFPNGPLALKQRVETGQSVRVRRAPVGTPQRTMVDSPNAA